MGLWSCSFPDCFHHLGFLQTASEETGARRGDGVSQNHPMRAEICTCLWLTQNNIAMLQRLSPFVLPFLPGVASGECKWIDSLPPTVLASRIQESFCCLKARGVPWLPLLRPKRTGFSKGAAGRCPTYFFARVKRRGPFLHSLESGILLVEAMLAGSSAAPNWPGRCCFWPPRAPIFR